MTETNETAQEPAIVRRAFVTGAAMGIGAAIARRLAAVGAELVLADIDGDALKNTAGDLDAVAVTLDVGDVAAVAAAASTHGPFHILINNAGIDQHSFFTQTTEDDWARLIRVNLIGTFATTHAVLPGMQGAGYGRIVNMSSVAGRMGSKGGAVYAAAKGGVVAFTKSIAQENARFGITCNAVAPGPIRTPMLDRGVAEVGEKLVTAVTDATLLRRLGTPEEVAAAAVFLASEDAGYITGETLGVTGGMGLG